VRLAADPVPSNSWPDPLIVAAEPAPEDGPVLISIPYDVPLLEREAFEAAVSRVEPMRRRDGAVSWQLYRDIGHPTRYLEIFETRSWSEHLRQHSRATLADEPLERELNRWRESRDQAGALHLVAVPLPSRRTS
jgi:quinol monooxygenase YgiN